MNEQITLSPELEARVHQAVENFMQGYGCCQSVVAALDGRAMHDWLPVAILPLTYIPSKSRAEP